MKSVSEVWKYHLGHRAENCDVPEGAQLLHVHEQNGIPCVWMRVDPSARKERRCFQAIGTGQQFSARYIYLGTAHCGSLVWHVFEVPNE